MLDLFKIHNLFFNSYKRKCFFEVKESGEFGVSHSKNWKTCSNCFIFEANFLQLKVLISDIDSLYA